MFCAQMKAIEGPLTSRPRTLSTTPKPLFGIPSTALIPNLIDKSSDPVNFN